MSGGLLLFLVVAIAIRVSMRVWRRMENDRSYWHVPPSAPRPSETIDAYYRRMAAEDYAMDDAEFAERRYREPLGMPRLGAAWNLDHLAEKEGHGGN